MRAYVEQRHSLLYVKFYPMVWLGYRCGLHVLINLLWCTFSAEFISVSLGEICGVTFWTPWLQRISTNRPSYSIGSNQFHEWIPPRTSFGSSPFPPTAAFHTCPSTLCSSAGLNKATLVVHFDIFPDIKWPSRANRRSGGPIGLNNVRPPPA